MKTETKHTQGPWRVWEKDDVMVAQVYGPKHPDGGDYAPLFETTNKANARLIAKSPELLEACESSAEFIGQTLEFLYEQFPEEEMQNDTPEQLLEAFDSAGYGSSKGELYRIVAQLKRTKQVNERAIAKATGGGQ